MGGKGYHGFVYLIRDPIIKRFYLGKKNYLSKSRKTYNQETDWRTYITSSKLMKEVWQHRPIEEFEFICLEQYKTKGTLRWAETWTLCHVEAPMSTTWYNTRIEGIAWKIKEPISERHRMRLKQALNFEEMK